MKTIFQRLSLTLLGYVLAECMKTGWNLGSVLACSGIALGLSLVLLEAHLRGPASVQCTAWQLVAGFLGVLAAQVLLGLLVPLLGQPGARFIGQAAFGFWMGLLCLNLFRTPTVAPSTSH